MKRTQKELDSTNIAPGSGIQVHDEHPESEREPCLHRPEFQKASLPYYIQNYDQRLEMTCAPSESSNNKQKHAQKTTRWENFALKPHL